MIPLINKSDRKVLAKADGIKNAVYYLDMIAFYDAYSSFVGFGISNLPNYCVIGGNLYLDGICLLIKDYSKKFGFATLDLTLDYLKYLYYSVAKYSKDGFLPERSVLTNEFELRKNASKSVLVKTIESAENAKNAYDISKSNYESQNSLFELEQKKSKKLNKFSIFAVIIGLVFAGLFIGLWAGGSLDLSIMIATTSISVALATLLVILFQKKNSKIHQKIKQMAKELKKLKNDLDEKLKNFENLSLKSDKITVDVNAYISCYKKLKSVDDLNITDEFLIRATDDNMLSYNLKYDISSTFDSHEKEILETVKKIKNISETDNEKLSNLYADIMKKNYLKNSGFVVAMFISKFIDNENCTHIQKLLFNDSYVNPFDIDTKLIKKERVAFLESKVSHFIAVPADRILSSKLITANEDMKIPKNVTADKLRNLKLAYLEKFYDLSEIEKLGNVFFASDSNKKPEPIDLKSIQGISMIPECVEIKLNLLQADAKIENSHNKFLTEILPQLIENPDILEDDADLNAEMLKYGDEFENIDLSGYKEVEMNFESNGISSGDGVSSVENLGNGKVKFTTDDGDEIIGFKF